MGKAVCSYSSDKIYNEIRERSVSEMFNLGYILQFIVYSFYYCTLAEQYSVIHGSQAALHVILELGNKLDTINKQLAEQILADVTLVTYEFAVYELDK